jgi:hypothetical protein
MNGLNERKQGTEEMTLLGKQTKGILEGNPYGGYTLVTLP